MKRLPVGVQVYSIREDAEKNFLKTMTDIKNMGYDGVELAGLYGYTPEKIKEMLEGIGLIPISAHVPYEELKNDLKGTVEKYRIIGCRYLVIPYLVEEKRYGTEAFDQFLKDVPVIAEECNKFGITLLYHNHDFEFARTKDGSYVLDFIYGQFPEQVLKAEIDTCWVKYSGVEPTAYMKQYANRCPVVHLKDYNGADPFEFRALGQGVQDISSLLETSIEIGAEWIIVEQDEHSVHSAMEDMRLSREYLRSLNW